MNVFLAIAVDNLADADNMTKIDKEEKRRKKEEKKEKLRQKRLGGGAAPAIEESDMYG